MQDSKFIYLSSIYLWTIELFIDSKFVVLDYFFLFVRILYVYYLRR